MGKIGEDTPIKRRCPECGQTKSLSEFNRYCRHKDGRATYCRDCQKTIQKHRYQTVWIRTWKGDRKVTITGITKRPYPHKCEICHRRVGIDFKWLNYHHWDDKDLHKGKHIKGIWVCPTCHFVCGVVDGTSLIGEKYLKLKRTINQQFKKRQLSAISER